MAMKHRFLLHVLSHTILVFDITEFGTVIEINPRTGNMKMVPALWFPVWKQAGQYLRAKGADSEVLDGTHAQLKKTGFAVLTVV